MSVCLPAMERERGEREYASKLIFYAQSASVVISGRGREYASKLMFYAQSTNAVISGRERERM